MPHPTAGLLVRSCGGVEKGRQLACFDFTMMVDSNDPVTLQNINVNSLTDNN